MKKLILIIVMLLACVSFSDNIIQRGVNNKLEYLAATGDGSDTLPYTAITQMTDTSSVFITDTPSVKLIGEYSNDAFDFIKLDGATNAVVYIGYEHYELHNENHYTFCVSDSDFDIADTLDLIITTADTTKWTHLVWSVSGALTTYVTMYYETTHDTASGTEYSIYNNDLNSTNTPLITIYDSDDAGADGTGPIDCASFGISTGQGISTRSGGGIGRGGNEWILKQNTKHLFRVLTGADDNNITVKFSMYLHTNKH